MQLWASWEKAPFAETQKPRWDEQETDANQPASPCSSANKQPWENVIGMGPEWIIISEGDAQKGTQETQQVPDQEDVRGNLGPGVCNLLVGAGRWEWTGLTSS